MAFGRGAFSIHACIAGPARRRWRCTPKIAAIERPAARTGALPPRGIGVQVPRDLHGVVQYTTDHEQAGLDAAVNEGAGPADRLLRFIHVYAALSGFRQPAAKHQPAVLANRAARRPIWPTKSSC